MFQWIEIKPPQQIGGIVAAAIGDIAMRKLVRYYGKYQYR